jgi:hypothetical protein
MLWESLVGILVMTVLIVVMGPALWSSRLSLREKLKREDRPPKDGP